LKHSIYGNECAENLYPSKYSKYDEELPKKYAAIIYSPQSAMTGGIATSLK
jgi:hypothetical protein